MFKRPFPVFFLLLLVQGFLPCTGDEGLFNPGFYGGPDDTSGTAERIWSTTRLADADISFAGPMEVQFSSMTRGELEYYTTPESIQSQLKKQTKKELLVIHLEKRFDYWMKPKKRKKAEDKIIEFGKKTGFKRCLILIARASCVGVLADFRNNSGGK